MAAPRFLPDSRLPKMLSEYGEYFTIGSVVGCETCHNQRIEGEVVAFDHQTKTLFLKKAPANGKTNTSDIHIVNLNYVEIVEVKKEASTNPPPLPPLNIEKLNARVKGQVEERQRLVAAMNSGVSQEGLKLFLHITKTINEVTWQGKNIVVMNQVTITPPYKPDNCKGKADSDALTHVRKIVEKHHKDQQLQQQQPQSSSSPSSSSSQGSSSRTQQQQPESQA